MSINSSIILVSEASDPFLCTSTIMAMGYVKHTAIKGAKLLTARQGGLPDGIKWANIDNIKFYPFTSHKGLKNVRAK